MAGPITICSLAGGCLFRLSRGALQALLSGAPVLLGRGSETAAALLGELGVAAAGTVDGLPPDAAAERLLVLARGGPLVFAVAGDPLADPAVQALLQAASGRGLAAEVAAGPTLLESLLAQLDLDRAGGLEVLEGKALLRRPPAGDLPALLFPAPRGEALQALMGAYPGQHLVTLIQVNGSAAVDQVTVLPLARLPVDHLDLLTALYVPPVAPLAPRRHPLDPLVAVMARLRGPGGCPWDREQTHLSLRRYMLEEAYEAVDAITAGDSGRLCEELGDVLLQVVFHAQLAREQGTFTIDDVVAGIVDKLIRRHPHVFGQVKVAGAADVVRNWQAIKAAEKASRGEAAGPPGILQGIDRGQPALSRAAAVQKRAAAVGFDWPDAQGAMAKVTEELAEVRAALAAKDPGHVEQEVGDLLFAAVNVSRLAGVDPEVALTAAVARFARRFDRMAALARARGKELAEMALADLDQLWEEAKGAEK